MKIDYEEIRGYFRGNQYFDKKSKNYNSLFCVMEGLIDSIDQKALYLKNLFVDNKELEIYIIEDNKIVIGKTMDGKKIEIKVLKLKDIKEINCECSYDEIRFHKIKLIFNNDEVIVFDSFKDTNDSWRYKFNEQIKELSKIFIDRY